MTKNELNSAFGKMTPDETQKELLLNTILDKENPLAHVILNQKPYRKLWFSIWGLRRSGTENRVKGSSVRIWPK